MGGEHAAVEAVGELAHDLPAVGRGAQRAPVDAVDRTGADPLPGPTQAYQRRPLVDDRAALDGDDCHLQDPVAAQGQAGCLDVDHREPGEDELGGHRWRSASVSMNANLDAGVTARLDTPG